MLPASLEKVLAAPAPPALTSLRQIEHVIFHIQENRSFDHYFGTLRGVRGFDDPTAIKLSTGRSVLYQPDPVNPDAYELPFHLDTQTTSAAAVSDISHAWTVQHAAWNAGKMDGWLPAHRQADGNVNGPRTMGYYTRADLPLHYALADAFTICDAYGCSVLGPTHPNRLYAYTGTIDPDGLNGGPVLTNAVPQPFTWTTTAERLQQAGIRWKVYQQADSAGNALQWFKQFVDAPQSSPLYQNGMQVQSDVLQAFRDDVAADRLPQVSWIAQPGAVREHPPNLPASGAYFTHQLLDALASNPAVWAKSVVFLTYDENGGFFDHVPPQVAPSGTAGEYVTVSPLPSASGGVAGPIGLGFRVPMLVISPWSQGGYVNHDVFDHTSMLRFLETRFGILETNISAWRRQTCGDLTSTLSLRRPAPTIWSVARLPSPGDSLQAQYISSQDLPAPSVPVPQSVPHQEPGTRPAD